MIRRFITLLFFFFPFILLAQQNHASRIKLYYNEADFLKLAKAGVALDHGERKQNVYLISDFTPQEVQLIKESGIAYEMLIENVDRFYAKQNENWNAPSGNISSAQNCNQPFVKSPTHFRLGKYAGFYEYDEMLAILDSMQLLYPQLISKREPIDSTKTWQGRPLYWVRISNNPTVDENKPEVFYNALHHAREPVTISQLIYYMWYLLDNYNTNPEIKGIVDHAELYFVPCVNPDGYIYNYQTNPNGGGFHRKNMRDPGALNSVDLNRNYGKFWGYDENGSSSSSGAEVYRGPQPFSEPETKMIEQFCRKHQFKLALSSHAYGSLLIYPWGYSSTQCPERNLFSQYASFMTKENGYTSGSCIEVLWYYANGSSSDWHYGEQTTKNKTFEFVPESGSSFYPAKNEIVPICGGMLNLNLKLAKLALNYVIATDVDPYYIRSKNGHLHYTYKNLVPSAFSKFTVQYIPLSPEIIGIGNARDYINVTESSVISDSISYELSPTIADGTPLKYILKISNDQFTHSDTITKIYGQPVLSVADSGNFMDNWESSSGWGLTSASYHSASSSITDSPNANYPNNTTSTLTSKFEIDLTGIQNALLTFWCKWDIEQGFDYAQLSASTDNGQNWIPLCGKYTSLGTSHQSPGQPIYDGVSSWVKEEIPLTDFLNQKIKLRFSVTSDLQNTGDGFYLDDLTIEKIAEVPNSISEQKNDAVLISNAIPNPSNEFATINYQLTHPEPAELLIYNAVGQIMYSEKIAAQSGAVTLTTSKWPNGIYYYFLKTKNHLTSVQKMCVTH